MYEVDVVIMLQMKTVGLAPSSDVVSVRTFKCMGDEGPSESREMGILFSCKTSCHVCVNQVEGDRS